MCVVLERMTGIPKAMASQKDVNPHKPVCSGPVGIMHIEYFEMNETMSLYDIIWPFIIVPLLYINWIFL